MPGATSTTTTTSTQDVLNLKESLLKALPNNGNDDDAGRIERCEDILQQLSECNMNLDILTETLIGATVNKLKKHKILGKTAKELIQQWKQVAANEQQQQTTTKTKDDDEEPAATAAASSANGEEEMNEKKKGGVVPAAAMERRESMESTKSNEPDYDPESEWIGLPDMRRSICQKLFVVVKLATSELLKQGVNKHAVRKLTGPRTAEIEQAIHSKFGRNDRKAYTDKARSLCFNMKKNIPLTVSVLLGQIEATELVNFNTEQLASDEIREQRQKVSQKLIDSKRLDWDQANEAKINEQCGIKGDLLNASLFTCGRCKSVKTTSTQKQTRSADEPMTVFVLCLSCGKRWKC